MTVDLNHGREYEASLPLGGQDDLAARSWLQNQVCGAACQR